MISKKNGLIFIVVISLVLFITGLIYGFNNEFDINEYLETLNNNNFLVIKHLLIIIICLFSTISLLGVIFIAIYIGFESISIGYLIANFILSYKTSGLLYGIITVLVNKGIYLLLLVYLFTVAIVYLKKHIMNIVGINNEYIKDLIIPLLKKYVIISIVIITYDIFLYVFGNMFLNYLTFML